MVFTIAAAVFGLSFVLAGRLQDRFGPLPCSIAGSLLISLGFYLCSFTTSLGYLYVCFGVIGGIGNGFGYATPIPVMAKWFPDKRGLAAGMIAAGFALGAGITVIPVASMIRSSGYQQTFFTFGLIQGLSMPWMARRLYGSPVVAGTRR